LHRGGTVASVNSTFRAVLDAALSSPTGRGVIVDETHRFAGTITAANVVRLLEEQQVLHEQRSVHPQGAGVTPR
jgi:osmoprotectant transport system ATP-binding protein